MRNLQITREQLYIGIRTGIASLLVVATLRFFGDNQPLSAIVAVALVTDGDPVTTRRRSVQRLLGAVLGAMVGVLFISSGSWNILLMAAAISCAMLLCAVLKLHYGMRMAGYMAGVLVLQHSDAIWAYSLNQFIEIAVGVGYAVLLSFIRYLPIGSTRHEADRFA
jgi:uncharacterized membrane protein YgaE (UPF0421/DUF939 family)